MDLDNLAQNNIYCEGWNFKQAKDKDSLFVTYDENSKSRYIQVQDIMNNAHNVLGQCTEVSARFINSWGYQILPTYPQNLN